MRTTTIYKNGVKIIVSILESDGRQPYIGLCVALVERLTQEQCDNLIVNNKKGNLFLYFQEILKCFDVKYYQVGHADDSIDCICGKRDIIYKNTIHNLSDYQCYTVGSTCVERWCEAEMQGCKFCGRKNKTNKDCKKCKEKQTKKKDIKNIFTAWRDYTIQEKKDKNEIITFGKYNGLKYYDICLNEKRYLWWINFVLSDECKTSTKNKEMLTYMLNKIRLQKNELLE